MAQWGGGGGSEGGAAVGAARQRAGHQSTDCTGWTADAGCTQMQVGPTPPAAPSPPTPQAHFNMGNLYRQCAEFGRAIQRCVWCTETGSHRQREIDCGSRRGCPRLPAPAGMAVKLHVHTHTPIYPSPFLRSYDNVLAIDASHWRSLLNKAVVQVRGRRAFAVWLQGASRASQPNIISRSCLAACLYMSQCCFSMLHVVSPPCPSCRRAQATRTRPPSTSSSRSSCPVRISYRMLLQS